MDKNGEKKVESSKKKCKEETIDTGGCSNAFTLRRSPRNHPSSAASVF